MLSCFRQLTECSSDRASRRRRLAHQPAQHERPGAPLLLQPLPLLRDARLVDGGSKPNLAGKGERNTQLRSAADHRLGPDKCDVLGRQGGSRAGLSEATLRRLDREGKLGLQRRRILGLPDTGTGGDE